MTCLSCTAQAGIGIVQGLLGHRNVITTLINTHVLKWDLLVFEDPLICAEAIVRSVMLIRVKTHDKWLIRDNSLVNRQKWRVA